MEKANVNDVALFFIALAQDSGEQLTHMKLQKLVYYSQAWYLGMRHLGTFLFCHGFVGYSSKTISCFAQFRVFRVFRGWIKYW